METRRFPVTFPMDELAERWAEWELLGFSFVVHQFWFFYVYGPHPVEGSRHCASYYYDKDMGYWQGLRLPCGSATPEQYEKWLD